MQQWVALPMHMSALEVAAMTILHGMIRTKGRASSDDDIVMVLRVCVYMIISVIWYRL